MLYSVQNAFGEVYGIFTAPETNKSAEGLAHELRFELEDILGINGVVGCPLSSSQTGERDERVVIDIEPVAGEERARLARVHEAIGRLTLPPQP